MRIQVLAVSSVVAVSVSLAGPVMIPHPTPLKSMAEVTKAVQTLYEAIHREDKLNPKRDEAEKRLAAAKAPVENLRAALNKVADEQAALNVEVIEFTNVAKEKPVKQSGETAVAFATRMKAYTEATERLPKLQDALEAKSLELAKAEEKFLDVARSATPEIDAASNDMEKASDGNVEARFADLKLHDTLQSLELDFMRRDRQIDLLVAHLDNAILGVYVQDKLEALLKSKELCDAVAGQCGKAGGTQRLDSMFDGKRTHSK